MEEADTAELLLKTAGQDITPTHKEITGKIVKVSLLAVSEPGFSTFLQVLYYLPLAIIQAGALIAKSEDLKSYSTLYYKNQVQLLSKKPAQSHDGYGLTVYTMWQISFDQLSELAKT
jgi:hypothetical protein